MGNEQNLVTMVKENNLVTRAKENNQLAAESSHGDNDGDNDGDNTRHFSGEDDLTFEEEWRLVAMTIDRLLFIGFMAIFAVGTFACFAHTKYVK